MHNNTSWKCSETELADIFLRIFEIDFVMVKEYHSTGINIGRDIGYYINCTIDIGWNDPVLSFTALTPMV